MSKGSGPRFWNAKTMSDLADWRAQPVRQAAKPDIRRTGRYGPDRSEYLDGCVVLLGETGRRLHRVFFRRRISSLMGLEY